jgi:N6-adenosine-specific RNA methylase IME4
MSLEIAAQLRRQLAASTDRERLERLIAIEEAPPALTDLPQAGRYGAILADPPWAFKTFSGKHGTPHRSAEDHYKTVEHAPLSALPVASIAAKDAVMFMWVVDSHVDQAIELAKAWGFGFKTIAFIWMKTAKSGQPRIGMGYWTRKSAEVCLMFTRGKPKRLDKGVREMIIAPRREHSRKPDEQYGLIERLVAGPYVELFARQSRPGWDSWGNQTNKFDVAA